MTKFMQLSELTSGSLVRQKHSNRVIRVYEVHPPYVCQRGEEGQYHIDTLNPIPITTDTLEKFGFTCPYIDGVVYVKNGCVTYPYTLEYNTGTHSLLINLGLVPKPIQYVHELQLALTLCGIEEAVVI